MTHKVSKTGSNRAAFMSSDQIILDIADSMKISNIEIDGKEAQFDNQG